MKLYVSNIQPGNQALQYIDKRLQDNNYRGSESSEHNRYDMAEIYQTLKLFDQYAPGHTLMRIRDTDLSKRPMNTPEERIYAEFCNDVKRTVGKGTQDSIRKNIFVDVHRMGLINRYDINGDPIDPYGHRSAKFVSLTISGANFINADLLNRSFIFSKALDNLLGGYIETALELLKDSDHDLEQITKWEFMFFVSAIGVDYDFALTPNQCAAMIHEYRLLSPVQKKAVVETLKSELQPHKFPGDKTAKRDWHNWQNKIDQVFHLFNQTPYFNVEGPEHQFLRLSTRKIKTKAGEIVDIRRRSLSEKIKYFEKHHVAKTDGYELHHVVPLSWAESPEQYKLFDQWINMVYIDAYSHAKITHNRNRNIFMSANGDDIILSDKRNHSVKLINKRCILYDSDLQDQMLKYNETLRTTLS